ncbi:MAG: cyclic lactone autoinducer peptide [Clostridium sp.]|nr:cyclic lactone autoinducer peptide [Clostridium sp.]
MKKAILKKLAAASKFAAVKAAGTASAASCHQPKEPELKKFFYNAVKFNFESFY